MQPKNGGPGQGIRHSITEMAKSGIINHVVCLDNPVEQYLTDKIDNFTIYALGPSSTGWQYSKALRPWLNKNLQNYDVVIVHGLWLYHGYAAYKAVKKRNALITKTHSKEKQIKFFVMPHGMLDPYFQKAGSRRLKAIRNFFYWYLVECKVIHFADAMLFTSKSELELARETFAYYKPKNEVNIGYGIPYPKPENPNCADTFRDKTHGLGTRPYWVFLSRIHEKKGIDLLLDGYKYLLENQLSTLGEQHIELPCIVIAGPGWDEPYGKMVAEKINAEPLFKNRVFTVGMITGDLKWGALIGAEAFVLPSHQENFGIAVAEALACHTPVLITNKVNIWREVEAAGAAIVADDTFEGVKGLLTQWLSISRDEKYKMRENAFKCFSTTYNISKPTENLLTALA